MTELKDIINSMVDRLTTFAVEVERVSLEVGTEGRLGGQAVVQGVEGTWRDLTAVVNTLAANLTTQVRSIAKVTKVCLIQALFGFQLSWTAREMTEADGCRLSPEVTFPRRSTSRHLERLRN